VWTGFTWPKAGSYGGFLWARNDLSCFIKGEKFLNHLLKKGSSCMELVYIVTALPKVCDWSIHCFIIVLDV